MILVVKGYYYCKNIQTATEHYKAIWWFRPSSMDLRLLFSHDFLWSTSFSTRYSIIHVWHYITLFHWFLVVQFSCDFREFFLMFCKLRIDWNFQVEKSESLNQKKKKAVWLRWSKTKKKFAPPNFIARRKAGKIQPKPHSTTRLSRLRRSGFKDPDA